MITKTISLILGIAGCVWIAIAVFHDVGIEKAIDLAWAATMFAEASWLSSFNKE